MYYDSDFCTSYLVPTYIPFSRQRVCDFGQVPKVPIKPVVQQIYKVANKINLLIV